MKTKEKILDDLRDSIAALDSKNVKKTIQEAIDNDINPSKIIMSGISKGGEIVGEKFENSEYFLSELIVAGEITKEALEILKPHIDREKVAPVGKIVIGTVEGDVHDIGKNIVIMFLQSRGFEVVDLGVDVPKEDFIKAIKEHSPQILGMSALMTLTAQAMGEVITMLEESGLREKVKIIIGGSPTTPEFGKHIGADYQTAIALEGVKKCLEWSKK